jgi:hypothetical protein
VSINVNVVGSTGITTLITNNETVNVGVGTAWQAQVPSLLVEAGANMTVTTTSGSFTVIGRDPPVTHQASDIADFQSKVVANAPVSSVAGRTGTVVLSAADIANLTSVANVVSVNGRTGVLNILGGSNVTVSTSTSGITVSSASPPVASVNGQTGAISILGGGNVTVSTSTSGITVASATPPVSSVGGLTGAVSIVGSGLTVSTSSSSIIISASTAASGGGIAMSYLFG